MDAKTSARLKSLETKHRSMDAKIKEMSQHHDPLDELQKSKKTKLKLKEQIENIKNCYAKNPN